MCILDPRFSIIDGAIFFITLRACVYGNVLLFFHCSRQEKVDESVDVFLFFQEMVRCEGGKTG